MNFGKMNTFVNVVSVEPTKDSEGFVNGGDNILASIRAYKEQALFETCQVGLSEALY